MEPPSVQRKLTAILSADVQDYSRLMDEDEEATLRTLQAYREVTDSLIQQHRGRIVGTAGDSVLAEFASVIDAVRCAVETQQQLKARNAELPAHRRMEFRIGINLGFAYILVGRYEAAIPLLKQALSRNPNFIDAHVNLVVCHAELGREEEARAEATEILRLSPHFSIEGLKQISPYKDPAVGERVIAALRKAGLK